MLDSSGLDDGGSCRSVCDRGGRTVLVSLRRFTEIGRHSGEGSMKGRPLKCKDNNAATVKTIMSDGTSAGEVNAVQMCG